MLMSTENNTNIILYVIVPVLSGTAGCRYTAPQGTWFIIALPKDSLRYVSVHSLTIHESFMWS